MAQDNNASEKIKTFLATPRPMLIDGEWVGSSSEEMISALNPATGERIAKSVIVVL